MVAEFRNDYTTTLNGNTNVLGDLYVADGLDVNGPTTLKTNPAHTGVGIINSSNQDILRVTDNGDVTVSGNLRTNTAQAKDTNQLTVNDNLTVTGTLNVNTFTPTILKSTGTPGIKVQSSTGADIAKFWNTGDTHLYGDVSITGSLIANNFSPWWVAGKIDGATLTILNAKGEKASEITCVRKSGTTLGVYDIRWTTPHPDGANWVGFVQGEGSSYNETIGAFTTGYTNISTGFTAIFRKLYAQPAGANEGLVDCPFTFYVMK
jgi:hypothetical protein